MNENHPLHKRTMHISGKFENVEKADIGLQETDIDALKADSILKTGDEMSYFPMFMQLQDKQCLIVGGGQVALRKVLVMLDFGACVTVVAPKVCGELSQFVDIRKTKSANEIVTEKLQKNVIVNSYNDITSLHRESEKSSEIHEKMRKENAFVYKSEISIQIIHEEFKENHLSGMEIVIAATDDRKLNHRIAELCRERHIPVNAVDQLEDCTFIVPAYLKRGEVVAAFSSGGKAPTITQYLKEKTEPFVTEELAELNDYLGEIRPRVKESVPAEAERKEVYHEITTRFLKNGRRLTDEELEDLISLHESQ